MKKFRNWLAWMLYCGIGNGLVCFHRSKCGIRCCPFMSFEDCGLQSPPGKQERADRQLQQFLNG